MKIEYEPGHSPGVWRATLSGRKIGLIVAVNSWPSDLPEVEYEVHVQDCTGEIPTNLPGSPFASVNQAKAAIEYHFRNLNEKA